MAYFLYILLCEKDKLYTGIAVDVEKRFDLHKNGKGAKYTQRNKPIKIVYKKRFKTRSEASVREAEIKKMTKEQKNILCKIRKD